MAVKIWHQSYTELARLGPYRDALQAHFKAVSQSDTQVIMHGMRAGTYETHYPGNDIKYAAIQHLHSLQFLVNGLRAEQENFDVYAISTLPEPALAELRGVLSIPVVGYTESAMALALTHASQFGVLVFIEELSGQIKMNARRYGVSDRLVDVCHVGFGFEDVLQAFDDASSLIQRFKEAARGLIQQGAQAIIPGEAPLNVLLARAGVNDVDGVPVIDSLAAWVHAAERAAQDATYRPLAAFDAADDPYYSAQPNRQRVLELLEFYGLTHLLQG